MRNLFSGRFFDHLFHPLDDGLRLLERNLVMAIQKNALTAVRRKLHQARLQAPEPGIEKLMSVPPGQVRRFVIGASFFRALVEGIAFRETADVDGTANLGKRSRSRCSPIA
jgi:hypothetical protein